MKQFPITEVREARDTYHCGDEPAHLKINRAFIDLSYVEMREMKKYGVHGVMGRKQRDWD